MAIGDEMRWGLGDWIRHRLKKGVGDQGAAAQDVLDNCGVSVTELQKQWADQQAAQLSIRARKYLFLSMLPFSLTSFLRCTCQTQERTRCRSGFAS